MGEYQQGYDDGTRHEQSHHGNRVYELEQEVKALREQVAELEENIQSAQNDGYDIAKYEYRDHIDELETFGVQLEA